MTRKLDTVSTGDRRRTAAYFRDFWPGLAGYALVLVAVILWGGLDGPSPWRFVWAVLPVLPALLVVRAGVRHLRRVDDYQRTVLLQGLATGFALAMIASVTVGLLGVAGLATSAGGWIIYSIGMLGWVVGGAVAERR
jgi:hypothetical protein